MIKYMNQVENNEIKYKNIGLLNLIRGRMAERNKRIVLRQHLNNLINTTYTIDDIRKELTYLNKQLTKSA